MEELDIAFDELFDEISKVYLLEEIKVDEFTINMFAARQRISRSSAEHALHEAEKAGRVTKRIAKQSDGRKVWAYKRAES